MDQQIKDAWVAALRSGTYKQGSCYLRDIKDNFCCLGVLCDLYAAEHGVDWFIGCDKNTYAFGDDEATAVLPRCVMEWAGMKTCEGRIGMPGYHNHSLMVLNDYGDHDFSAIADVIESRWIQL
jgi:hypothetical protein